MASNHVSRPDRIAVTVGGERVNVYRDQARLLSYAGPDGWVYYPGTIGPPQRTTRNLINRGWLVRTQGRFRLTPAGVEARDAVAAYQARKQHALNGDTSE